MLTIYGRMVVILGRKVFVGINYSNHQIWLEYIEKIMRFLPKKCLIPWRYFARSVYLSGLIFDC